MRPVVSSFPRFPIILQCFFKSAQKKSFRAGYVEHFYITVIMNYPSFLCFPFSTSCVLVVQGVIRTNSCQSDSSGFLEELFIPSLSQQASEGSELIKVSSLTIYFMKLKKKYFFVPTCAVLNHYTF